jgi:predicted transcriptional regulator
MLTLFKRPIRFPALRSLSLKGNPVENDEENYPLMPLAILSDLSFLDFKMVDSVLREKGLEKYEIKVLETKDNEIKEIKMREKAELEAKEKQDRVNAFVNHVPQLFDLMYEEDVDGNIINQIPEIMEVVENFKESINKVCITIVEEGLVRLKTRTAEIDDLLESRNAAIDNANQRATHLVDEFLALQEANASSEDLSKKIDELDNELMEIEVTLNEKIDETIKEFERYFSDMCASFLEYTSGQYTKIREIQALHNERMQEDSQVQLERFIKNDVPDDVSCKVHI